jgi:hypothetical protein
MKTLLALVALARCAVTLLECTYSDQVAPVEFQFGGGV